MTSTRADAPVPTRTLRIQDVPSMLPVATVVGLIAFVVSIEASSVATVNGAVTACSYTDFAALGAAVLCGIAAVVGAIQRVSNPWTHRAAWWLVGAFVAVDLLLAGIHVLRGLGVVGGIC